MGTAVTRSATVRAAGPVYSTYPPTNRSPSLSRRIDRPARSFGEPLQSRDVPCIAVHDLREVVVPLPASASGRPGQRFGIAAAAGTFQVVLPGEIADVAEEPLPVEGLIDDRCRLARQFGLTSASTT